MRTAIIPDDAKRLIRPKQAVGAGKCLNQPFVLQHLIQIQRVDPLGIKSRQHLIHHDQQVDLFFRGALHPLIRRFVRKTSRNVLFHFGKGGDAKLLPIPGIVIFDDLLQSLFFGDPGAIVVNVRVKEYGHFQPRSRRLETSIVLNGFRDAGSCKNGVELAKPAQCFPVFADILHHRFLVFLALVLAVRDIVLNALDLFAKSIFFTCHRQIVAFIEHLALLRVGVHLIFRSLCLFQCNGFPQVTVLKGQHFVGVKAQNVFIPDAIGDAVPMQLVAKDRGGGAHLLLVFTLDRRTSKAKEHSSWEGMLDGQHHIAKGRAVALVYDKNDPLCVDDRNIIGIQSGFGFLIDVAHFLDGSDDERVRRGIAFQFSHQHIRVFGGLYLLIFSGEIAVLLQALSAQLDSVHQKNHFVRILGRCNQLSGLKRSHGLAGTCGVPDVAAALLVILPFRLGNGIRNFAGSVVLITAHHLQNAIGTIGHSIKAYQHMRHRNGQKCRCNVFPVVHRLVIEVRPMEIVAGVELSFRAGIGKVDRFFRVHGHKNLHQREQSRKNALCRVFFNLVASPFDGNTALFQFHVNDRHTIDEQHQIAAAVIQNLGLGGELWLLCDLVAAESGCNFQSVIDFQGHFFAEIQLIVRIVTLDKHTFAVDKFIQLHRRFRIHDLFHDLLHLAIRQRIIVQSVNAAVVLKKDVRPVLDQLLFGVVFQHTIFPAAFYQELYHRLFKIGFFCKRHNELLSTLQKAPLCEGFSNLYKLFQLTLMKGDKGVNTSKAICNFLLLCFIFRVFHCCFLNIGFTKG